MNIGFGLMAALLASGSSIEAAGRLVTPVCMSSSADFRVARAKQIAGWLLGFATVHVEWLPVSRCPPKSIVVTLQPRTPDTLRPEWFAYSQPFEGTQIIVFLDRIQAAVPARRFAQLLGHVLAHEIAHMIEGTDCHSSEGVMKVRWSGADYLKMDYLQLRFTESDIQLIRQGLPALETRRGVVLDDTRYADGRH